MPAFNRQDTIAYAIESVLNQKFEDFELILVDDASQDCTLDIMRFYHEKDSRVHIVRNRNNSRNASIEWEPRNDGLKIAGGELIAYLDSDNLWDPEFLDRCASFFLEDKSIVLSYCNSRNHYKDEKQFDFVLSNEKRRLLSCSASAMTATFEYDHNADGFNGPWYIDTNEMMHRSDVFRDLEYLWATRHPDRKAINARQLVRCEYRRHNDQELAERIVRRYGVSAVKKVDDTLVEFFYAPRQHQVLRLLFKKEVDDILGGRCCEEN
jgi:glycosyltransferase involved in cell wall biosynthesis